MGVMEEIKEQNNEHGSNFSGQKRNKKKEKEMKKILKKMKSAQKLKNPERKTSQEMNEIIWNFNNEEDEPIRPRVRNTGGLVGMKKSILGHEKSESKVIKSEDSSEFKLNDEEDELMINKSIEDSNSS